MVGLTRPTCGIYLGILSMARSRKLLKLGGQWAASVMTQMKTLPNKKTGIQKYLVVNKQPQLWREWKLFRRLLWHSDYLCTTLKLLSSGDQGWRDCLIWYKYNYNTNTNRSRANKRKRGGVLVWGAVRWQIQIVQKASDLDCLASWGWVLYKTMMMMMTVVIIWCWSNFEITIPCGEYCETNWIAK